MQTLTIEADSQTFINRQINIPQYPKLLVFPVEHGRGCPYPDYAQHNAWPEQSTKCHADLVY